MDPCSIYTITLAAAFAILIGWHVAAQTAHVRHKVTALWRKNIQQTAILRRPHGTFTVTVHALLHILGLAVANTVAISVGDAGVRELAHRLGVLSIVNAIPLFVLSGRDSFISNVLLGFSLPSQSLAHRWIGRICLGLAIAHALLHVTRRDWGNIPLEVSLVVTACAMVLSSVLYFRRWCYESFLKSHHLMALALVAMLWFHVRLRRSLATFALATLTFMWVLQMTAKLASRTMQGWKGRSDAVLTNFATSTTGSPAGVAQLRITLRKPWHVKPGQYVYLTVPSVSRFAFLQAHPYLIAWAGGDTPGEAKEIVLLIQARRGFSNQLRLSDPHVRVVVTGPFGGAFGMNGHDKVLFMATGVGVAAHMLSIRQLLFRHDQQTARVRRVSLVWVLESPEQESWALSFIEQLMDEDRRRIFTALLCLPARGQLDASAAANTEQDAKRPRIFRVYGHLDADWMIKKEWSAEAGNMLVCLCGSPGFEMQARKAIRRSPHDIALVTSDFEMDADVRYGKAPPGEVGYVTKQV